MLQVTASSYLKHSEYCIIRKQYDEPLKKSCSFDTRATAFRAFVSITCCNPDVKQNTNESEKSTKIKSIFPHTGLSTQTKVRIFRQMYRFIVTGLYPLPQCSFS